jgi:hypothetical protein
MSKEALRLALEALEDLGMKHYENTGEVLYKETFTAIKAALEAKDEPVAWRDAAIRLGEELSSVGPNGYYDMDAKEWLDWAMEQNPRGKHSLPQRTWAGLTDEEVWECYSGQGSVFYRAIEAKLREKNCSL